MDVVLRWCDQYFFEPYIYPSSWGKDDIFRQFTSLFIIATIGGYALYFTQAGLSYAFIFDKRLLQHPLILENQIWKEIKVTCSSVPLMSFLSVCCFLLEVRGYSKLYDATAESYTGWFRIPTEILTFVLFTDCLIYWIHRSLHSRLLYRRLHKTHHLWKVSTPFASHAFHPVDGFLQSFPYHLYVFLFPMHKFAYLAMFVLVNMWTVSIHDGDYRVPRLLRSLVNGSAHHTDHHLYYNYNYGQFFTFWDRMAGSFREPSAYQGNSPIDQLLNKEIMENFDLNRDEVFCKTDNYHKTI